MKVLILGGTTFFGREIARLFHEEGHEVTLFTRGNRKPADLPPVHYLRGDRGNLSDLERAAREAKWDCVVDNLAFDGPAVEAALKAFRGVGRYLLTSTVSVYRFSRSRFPVPWREEDVDHGARPAEENPNDVHWSYARGKLEAERRIISQKQVPWTVFRPTVVYGPFDPKNRGFWYLERMRRGGPLLVANGGAGSFRLVYGTDVARAYRLAAENDGARGRIYNLAQKEIVTLEDFLRESAKALELKPDLVPVPGVALTEALAGPHGRLVNVIPDTAAAERELGFEATPFAEFCAKTALWFNQYWNGDRAELLATRPEELALAERWKERLS